MILQTNRLIKRYSDIFTIYNNNLSLSDRGYVISTLNIDSDIDFIEDLDKGSCFSLLYENKLDLVYVIAAFFDAGFRNNECCLWAVSGQFDKNRAASLLKDVGLDVDRYLESGQFMILSCDSCYISGEVSVTGSDLNRWAQVYDSTLKQGYQGLRVVDKFTIVGKDSWDSFLEYGKKARDLIKKTGIICMFSFLLNARTVSEILDIIDIHDGTIIKKEDKWTLLQSSSACRTISKQTDFIEGMFENVWTGVWAVDKDDNIVYFNKGMESISGLLVSDVIGKKIASFISCHEHDDNIYFTDVFHEVKQTLSSRSYDVFPFIKPDGHFIYHSGILIPLKDDKGNYAGVLGTIGKPVEQKIVHRLFRDKLRSIERLEDIYRTSPVVAFLWSAKSNWPVLFVSENVSQFGYNTEDFMSGDISYSDIVHPDDIHVLKDEISQLEIQDKMFFSKEYRLLTKKGDIRWVTERSYLVRDEKGTPVYYQGIVIDINDRKNAEDAAFKAEKKYRLIFENSPLGLFYFNEKGMITNCNEQFLDIIHLHSKGEIIGFNMVTDIVDEAMRKAIDDVIARKMGHFEGKYHTVISGQDVHIKADYSPNIGEDGAFLGGIGIFEDISARKKAEAELRLDESRLEALLKVTQMKDTSIKGISDFVQEEAVRLTQSRMGYLALLNDQLNVLKIYSWSGNIMSKCKVRDMNIEYPLESTGLWGEPIRQGKAIIVNDFDAPNKNKHGYPQGHIKLKRYMSIPIFDGKKIVGSAGVANKDEEYNLSDVRQMTLLMEGILGLIQHKRDGDKLREYADELSRVNAELKMSNAELLEVNKELKSLDLMKDDFLSNVSHEFKTPLTSIQGYSQLVADQTLGSVNDQQKKAVGTIIRNAERLRRLVDSLLYLSRSQSGKLNYSFEVIKLNDIINSSIQDLALQAEGKDIILVNDISDDLPSIQADRDKMTDVFVNLIDNAIKFTPKGGRVIISAYLSEDFIYVEVEDTGIGIPEDKIPKLFERFYQVDSSVRRRYGGTGLGLYICKKIVLDHNGGIYVTSKEGKGTKVHILLPMAK